MNHLSNEVDYSKLVKQAQLGCKESMDCLAEAAKERLCAYIYRITVDYDLTQDLLQETLLEMAKSLKNLKQPDRFWPWMYRVALGKTQHYYRAQKRKNRLVKMTPFNEGYQQSRDARQHNDGLTTAMRKELSQAIFAAMDNLKFRHRSVLVLRCLENRSYSEIADIMDCSPTTAQVSFFRAKNLLKKQLLKNGFSKAFLLVAMGLFARLTAPTEASSAMTTVSATSTEVGLTASIIGTITTKLGIAIFAIIAGAIITTASFVSSGNADIFGITGNRLPDRSSIKSFHFVKQAWSETGQLNLNLARGRSLSKGAYEQWYYFPEGIDGPMFMIMQRWDPQMKNKLCGWLQNASGNYYYHAGEKNIYINNYHLPMRDLSTRRLPSDTAEFTEFLDNIEGKTNGITYTRDTKTGLLTGILDDRFYNAENFRSGISYNILDEKSFGSFRYRWPDAAKVVDNRDVMHKRGWTYFRITGQIRGENVSGGGKIPFVYDSLKEHRPWLKLEIGSKMKITDCLFGAYLQNSNGQVVTTYPAGSFFTGLSQPWMGMHTIDIIRRHAAQKKIRFETQKVPENDYEKVNVILFQQTNYGQLQFVYTINMDKDLVEKMQFKTHDGAKIGELAFDYLQEAEPLLGDFSEPEKLKSPPKTRRETTGILWLFNLAQHSF